MSDEPIYRLRRALSWSASAFGGYSDDIAVLLNRLDAAEAENERLRSESKAQLEELGRIDDALGTNEGPSAVDHIMILKTENERLLAENEKLSGEHSMMRALLLSAQESSREDYADAERYRWLRGDACPDHSVRWTQWEVRCWVAPFWSGDLRREGLDRSIDAAMAAEIGRREGMNWIKTSDMLPPSGKKVIAAYRNRAGNWRQIMAFWVAPKTEEANEEWEEGTAEYDEEADCYWVKSGWYEQLDNWDEYASCAVGEGEVSHWQPRPEPPSDERMEG